MQRTNSNYWSNRPDFIAKYNKSTEAELPCEKASCTQADPTFGAPSFRTQSTFQVWSSFFRAWALRHRIEMAIFMIHGHQWSCYFCSCALDAPFQPQSYTYSSGKKHHRTKIWIPLDFCLLLLQDVKSWPPMNNTHYSKMAHTQKRAGESYQAMRANFVSSDIHFMLDDYHLSKLLFSSVYGRVSHLGWS